MLLPSMWEDNCPLVMLEAQARATAAIVSDRGGPPEFVRDGREGFVVNPEDTGAMSDRIRRLADDPGLAEQYGEQGRERLLATHGADEHYERLSEVYQEALMREANAYLCSRAGEWRR